MPADPTIIRNTSFSDSTGTGGPRVNIDYRMQLIRQRENAAPFLAYMLHLNSEPTKTHEFRVFETRPNPKKALIAGAVAAGGSNNATVTVNVATGKGPIFTPGDIVRAAAATAGSGQTIIGIVTAITTDALTVRPNDPAKKIAAMADGDTLLVLGNSWAQGALSPQPSGTKPDRKDFFTQIFKNAYQVTKTHENNRLYGAPERDRLRGEAQIAHMIEINKAMYFGDGVLDTTNDSDPRTTMTGVDNQLTTNKFVYGAALTKDFLFDAMVTVHSPNYGQPGNMNARLILASAQFLSDVNKIAEANRRTVNVETEYGMRVAKVSWVNYDWKFVEDPVLSLFFPGRAYVIQPRYIKIREFRPTLLQANIQANDADHIKDQFLTEVGVEVQLEELHARFDRTEA